MLFHWAWALEVLPSNPIPATILFRDTTRYRFSLLLLYFWKKVLPKYSHLALRRVSKLVVEL